MLKSGVEKGKQLITGLVNWVSAKVNFTTKNNKQHSIYVEANGSVPVIMVESQKQKMADYFTMMEPKINSLEGKEKEKKSKALSDAKSHYDGAIVIARVLADLGREKEPDQNAIDKKTVDLRKEFDIVGKNIKVLGFGEIEPLNIATKIAPTSGTHLTSIEANPLTPVPGNTRGQAPARGDAGPTIPGWPHLKAVNKSNPKFKDKVFNDWLRMHLIHEHLHGPAQPFNLVAANTAPNTQAYNSVEKFAVDRMKDPEAVLWYKTTVSWRKATTAKPWLSDFPESVSMSWGEQTVKEDGTLDPGPKVKGGDFDVNEPPDLTGAAPTGIQNLKLRGLPWRTLFNYFGAHGISQDRSKRIANAYLYSGGKSIADAINEQYPQNSNDRFISGDLAAVNALDGNEYDTEDGRFKVDIS